MSEPKFRALLEEARRCRVCAPHLPHDPRPVIRGSATARLLIVGQAPGRKVQDTGLPWNDASGDRLRLWLGLDRLTFYDESLVAMLPMGFCFPGTGARGDLPPRPECAPLWHARLRSALRHVKLTLLVGRYAQAYYLGSRRKQTVAATVRAGEEYLPEFFPLPHPSPRNQLWFKAHPWLAEEVVPEVRRRVLALVGGGG